MGYPFAHPLHKSCDTPDAAVKARAIRRAREVGAAQTARELEIPSGTVRSWLSREPPTQASLAAADNDELARLKAKAQRGAEQALDRLDDIVPRATGVQSLAVTSGVLIDKRQQLVAAIQADEDRQQRLAAEQGQTIAALITLSYEALGLETTDPIRDVIADLLRRASRGEPLAVSPSLAAAAQADVARQLSTLATAIEDPRDAIPALTEQSAEDIITPGLEEPNPEDNPDNPPTNPVPRPPSVAAEKQEDEIPDVEVVDEPEPPATSVVRSWPGERGAAIPRFGAPTTREPVPSRWATSRNALP